MISSQGLAKLKQEFFFCFVYFSALGLCLDYDLMLMIMTKQKAK